MQTQSGRWRTLVGRLGVQTIALFMAELGGVHVTFAAMLPQFGSIANDRRFWLVGHRGHTAALLEAGYGYSCVTLGEDDDEASACEMLRDWGRADESEQPDWL